MRKFKLLYLAPVFALIALLCWALASPPGSSPDDDFHLASIWCANASNTSACEPGHSSDQREIPPAVYFANCYARDANINAGCQADHSQSTVPSVLTKRGSFQNNYPPVYYATMSLFVGPSFEGSIFVMRMVNIFLLIGFTSALWALLPRRRRPALIGGWLLTSVPLGLFLIASNNPSSWALIGVASAWLALLGFFETVGRRKILLGALFVLAVIMAAGARGDAALYTVLGSVVVLILSFARTRAFLLNVILPAVLAVVALIFFLSSRQSTVAVVGLGDGTQPGSHSGVLALALKDLINVPSLWFGSFGTWALGWLDTALPTIVPFASVLALVLIVMVGLRNRFRRKTIALVLVGVVLWALPTYVLVAGANQVGENVQPRYILPIIVLGVGVTLLGVVGQRIVWSRTVLIVSVAALSLAETVAMYINMRRYIVGVTSREYNLDSGIQWWWNIPIPPMLVLVIGSLAWLALLITFAREVSKTRAIS